MKDQFKEFTSELKAQMLEAFSKKENADALAIIKAATDAGAFEVVISTADVDRQGDSIDQNAWDLKNYFNNPIVLWAHDYWALPIGICDSISVQEGKLIAKGRFAPEEANPFAQQVRRLYDAGIVRATSVGYIPEFGRADAGKGNELLEFSFVPVPANAQALRLSQVKELGLNLEMLTLKGLTLETQPDEPVKEKGEAEVQQIGAILSGLQGDIDARIIAAAKEILAIADTIPTKQTTTPETAAGAPPGAGGAGEEQQGGAAPKQRSIPAGLDGERKRLDDFAFGREVLRNVATVISDSLERYNNRARETGRK